MTKPYKISLHLFRRDLRLQDNTALLAALDSSELVIPAFIFDPRQIEKNDYKSNHAIQFMITSLTELDTALQKQKGHLYYFYGIAEDVVHQLLNHTNIDAVFINRDYTPFSIARDKAIEHHCRKSKTDFHAYADALLHEPEQGLKKDGHPYTVYTHAFRHAIEFPVAAPVKNDRSNYYQAKINIENQTMLAKLAKLQTPALAVKGGRQQGIHLLKSVLSMQHYAQYRDFPAKNSTSKLSAHNKFGTLSIREVYWAIAKALGKDHTLIRELYWRDFFTHIAYHFPKVFGESFHEKYKNIAWSNNEKQFRAWCEGRTGFPIVDAGMRELNSTGYMHNRVRMITASFLTKDLHIDWRWGEKYFAQQLVDYDPAVNNGNWQWAASTGCDAQPYFRIFNPWLQQEKFDADALYIKRFIPELAKQPSSLIHQLAKPGVNPLSNYPLPMVNHTMAAKKAKELYKNAR